MVGEIGIPREDFLHRMQWWEIRSVIRGYDRRRRDPWSIARWHAYNIMSAIPYCDLTKKGIYHPTDLIHFPWDNDNDKHNTAISDDEAADLVNDINAFNDHESHE